MKEKMTFGDMLVLFTLTAVICFALTSIFTTISLDLRLVGSAGCGIGNVVGRLSFKIK